MPDISNFYSDGSIKWTGKSSLNASNVPTPTPNTTLIRIIYAPNGEVILSDRQPLTAKIVINNSQVSQLVLEKITTVVPSGNQLILHFSDELPLTIIFPSISDCLIADNRLTICINGGFVN